MTRDEYQRICDQIAREAIAYAAEMAEDEDPTNVTDEREHWIDVFLDEQLPAVDANALLAVTTRAAPAPSREIAARCALQMDVWDAINRTEES